MKKAALAACCSLLIAFVVVASLKTSRAINPQQPDQMASVTLSNDLTMQDMTQRSELIIMGQCTETRSTWVDGRRLVTLATISVSDAIKGSASTVTVALPGGVDSNRKHPIAMNYPGAPTIQPQENVFLFLTPAADTTANAYSVMGFAQGKFSIVKNDAGQDMVSRDLSKMRINRAVGVVRGQHQLIPLSEFKERIKGYLQ